VGMRYQGRFSRKKRHTTDGKNGEAGWLNGQGKESDRPETPRVTLKRKEKNRGMRCGARHDGELKNVERCGEPGEGRDSPKKGEPGEENENVCPTKTTKRNIGGGKGNNLKGIGENVPGQVFEKEQKRGKTPGTFLNREDHGSSIHK